MKSLVEYILESSKEKIDSGTAKWDAIFLAYAKQLKSLKNSKEVDKKVLDTIEAEETFCHAAPNGEGKTPLTFNELNELDLSYDKVQYNVYDKGSSNKSLRYWYTFKDSSGFYMCETDSLLALQK